AGKLRYPPPASGGARSVVPTWLSFAREPPRADLPDLAVRGLVHVDALDDPHVAFHRRPEFEVGPVLDGGEPGAAVQRGAVGGDDQVEDLKLLGDVLEHLRVEFDDALCADDPLAVAQIELDVRRVELGEAGEIARVEAGDVSAEIVFGHVSGLRMVPMFAVPMARFLRGHDVELLWWKITKITPSPGFSRETGRSRFPDDGSLNRKK